jgi:hypothetical protein
MTTMGSVNPALIAAAAAVLMVQAGLAKHMLAWRPAGASLRKNIARLPYSVGESRGCLPNHARLP